METILRKASMAVVRDYNEIRAMRSSQGFGIAKYIQKSQKKAFTEIANEISKIAPSITFVENGEIIINDDKEVDNNFLVYINVFDGMQMFSVGSPMFSISIAICEKNNNKITTNFAAVFSPIQNEFFYADREEGFSYNGIKIKRNIVANQRSSNLYACQNSSFISSKNNLIICDNKNLGLCYLGMGIFDSFVDLATSNKDFESIAGSFICKMVGINLNENITTAGKITSYNF